MHAKLSLHHCCHGNIICFLLHMHVCVQNSHAHRRCSSRRRRRRSPQRVARTLGSVRRRQLSSCLRCVAPRTWPRARRARDSVARRSARVAARSARAAAAPARRVRLSSRPPTSSCAVASRRGARRPISRGTAARRRAFCAPRGGGPSPGGARPRAGASLAARARLSGACVARRLRVRWRRRRFRPRSPRGGGRRDCTLLATPGLRFSFVNVKASETALD
jgi:hypothetical protein